ncbi:MAG TPA: aminotransferase class III-fold pyridoxal phosphate-dependent enzyme [Vicinamibacterales bacterium]
MLKAIRRFVHDEDQGAYGADVIEHSIPSRLDSGETYGIRATVRNTGSLTWRRSGPHPVDLFVLIDDELYQKVVLPHGDVAPHTDVTFHFALRLSKPGTHRVRLELVHHLAAWFRDRGAPGVAIDVHSEDGPRDRTALAFERSLARNLWHFQPTSGVRRLRDGSVLPLFVASAKGCRITDPEGHEFLDYTSGWGSTILGYADDRIQTGIAERLATAPLAPFPDPLEMDVSEMIAADFPSAEMVVFGKNGSDACTVAARLARATTGHRQILSCGFHGWQDFSVEETGEFHRFRFNDADGFRRIYEQFRSDLAAIMIEPAGPFISPDEGLSGDPHPAFLALLAQSARDAGALLVFDEIITGYRYRQHSVQRATGIVPDLTCLGKALASGMPLAAVAGQARIFHDGFAKTHYCPTFKAEIYSLAAAKRAIEIYRTEPVGARIEQIGARLKAGMNRACADLALPAECRGPAFRFSLVFLDPDPAVRRLARTLYMQELLRRRIVTANGVMLPNWSHSDADVDDTLHAVFESIDVVASAVRRGDLDARIEIPLL